MSDRSQQSDPFDRPTPEQIVSRYIANGRELGNYLPPEQEAGHILGYFRQHGYVIVHPDDHPPLDPRRADSATLIRWQPDGYDEGWNDARRSILYAERQ